MWIALPMMIWLMCLVPAKLFPSGRTLHFVLVSLRGEVSVSTVLYRSHVPSTIGALGTQRITGCSACAQSRRFRTRWHCGRFVVEQSDFVWEILVLWRCVRRNHQGSLHEGSGGLLLMRATIRVVGVETVGVVCG